ncbi:short-chain dehydrogenase [Neorhizobium sp. T25_13]|uniref:short-chain dehydrogenase n=1 Tax=Neorhizobium sp. T25_13 TaxID=2093830 RepID=UPI000CF8F899
MDYGSSNNKCIEGAIRNNGGSHANDLDHRLVEPEYAPTTRFAKNSSVLEDLIPPAYADFAAPIFAAFAKPALTTKETDVAEAIWAAVNDSSGQLRFPAGPDAVELARAGGII